MKKNSIAAGCAFAILAILALPQTPAATATGHTPSVAERIRQFENGLLQRVVIHGQLPVTMKLADRMAHYKTPGVSVAVINQDAVEWAKGYGLRETGGSQPVTTDTVFQAGSISKPVAAAAALHLVEEGKLSLDQDVNQKLVSWKLPENDFTRKEKVTPRRILSHSAGLTVHGFPGYAAEDRIPTLTQVLDGEKPANTAAVRADILPGSEWRYSGGGYTVLQQLMIDVSGMSFPALLHRTVFEPLGMEHSSYEQPPSPRFAEMAASGHLRDGSVVKGKWHVYPEMAAAGLWTTPSDLCRFGIAIAKAYLSKSRKVLSAKVAKEMLTPQIDHWGLGFNLQGSGKDFHFSHGGDDWGFKATLIVYPNRGQGAVVMSNSDNGSELDQEIMLGIAHEYGWPDPVPIERTLVRVNPAIFGRYAGKYEIPQTAKIKVTVENGRLYISDGSDKEELLPESDTKYFLMDGSEVTFLPDASGHVNSFIYQQGSLTITVQRAK
jgi:CubicO group peptidase (beta-lactamase class C family)